MIRHDGYRLKDPDALETPAMLLFHDAMEHNIRSVCELVGGGENLLVHVKTHKSEAVARKEVEHGIAGFKCATLKELGMVLKAGAGKAILAYPQVQARKLDRFCDLVSQYPEAWIATIISSRAHLEVLSDMANERQLPLNVMIDLDAGMHRTGIGFGDEARQMYRDLHGHDYLQPAGLHLYDGHEHHTDLGKREAAARVHIEDLKDFQRQLESEGLPVRCVVAGGSFAFAYYARTDGMYGSPGTFIYWDAGFRAVLPDMPFRYAALVLTQVVDRYPAKGTFTTDLGCKAICTDLPEAERAVLLGHETAHLVLQDEEHGVFRKDGELPQVGDYLLAVPGHVCTTTIRYPGIHVIDGSGERIDYFPHTARDRQ
jgi:D-serine deaminase-like pyridoxal phosphate-dependent protein